ncbi:MAG: hypothetical protein KDC03_20440 [Flavobacteriales bacterium]|nr:hypothetical protein [Flavobacteriales bacterium]
MSSWFERLPKDVRVVRFDAARRYFAKSDIILPVTRYLEIDGCGAELLLAEGSNGFSVPVADQEEAMARVHARYYIHDFGLIREGRRAIDLRATKGSVIENVQCLRQTDRAISLEFCLRTKVEQVKAENPFGIGFYIGVGSWPGASGTRSQSNHTVLDLCEVYCHERTSVGYFIDNSNGVVLDNCVSEGGPSEFSVFFTAAGERDADWREPDVARNPVVKQFTVRNLHIEHPVRQANVYVNAPAQCVVELDKVYFNTTHHVPIRYVHGQLVLRDIGWWRKGMRVQSRTTAPRIAMIQCHHMLDPGTSVVLFDPIGGTSDKVKTTHIKRRGANW